MQASDGSTIDPYIELINPRGRRVAANDDTSRDMFSTGLNRKDAVIRFFRVPLEGTYTIRATRFGRETTSTTGGFTLSLTLNKSSYPGTITPPTVTWTPSPTFTPSNTATFTATATPTCTRTATATATPTWTLTPRPTRTATATIPATSTRTATQPPTNTPRPTKLPTFTPKPPTKTPTKTLTP
jgi:hypothetical protein